MGFVATGCGDDSLFWVAFKKQYKLKGFSRAKAFSISAVLSREKLSMANFISTYAKAFTGFLADRGFNSPRYFHSTREAMNSGSHISQCSPKSGNCTLLLLSFRKFGQDAFQNGAHKWRGICIGSQERTSANKPQDKPLMWVSTFKS